MNSGKELAWERWTRFTYRIGLKNLLRHHLTTLQQQTIFQAFISFIRREIQQKEKMHL